MPPGCVGIYTLQQDDNLMKKHLSATKAPKHFLQFVTSAHTSQEGWKTFQIFLAVAWQHKTSNSLYRGSVGGRTGDQISTPT